MEPNPKKAKQHLEHLRQLVAQRKNPFETGFKYETLGLKSADAFIAAYAEWVAADALVSENRHFLKRTNNLPFAVVTAEECLRLMTLPKG